MLWKGSVSPAWLAALLRAIAASRVPFDDKIHQALSQADGEEQDHDAQYNAVIFGQPSHGVVEDQQQHGADYGTEECRDAAQHVDEDALPRDRPVGEFGISPRHEQ